MDLVLKIIVESVTLTQPMTALRIVMVTGVELQQRMNVEYVMAIIYLVRIVMVYPMDLEWKIIVAYVTLIHPMTVRKIAMEIGVAVLKKMNVESVLVMGQVVVVKMCPTGKIIPVPMNLQQPFQVELFKMKVYKWVMMEICLQPLMQMVMSGVWQYSYSHLLDLMRELQFMRCK